MRPRFDKLSQDGPTVLNGTNEYEDVLVGTFHGCTQLSGRGESSELASRSLGRVIRDAVIPHPAIRVGVHGLRVVK